MLTSIRTSGWPLRIIAVAVILAATGLLLARLDVIGGPAEASAGERSTSIGAELTRRMATTLEQLPPERHEAHGGHGGAEHGTMKTVCAARVYGYEPASAATADDVVTVYGFHFCGMAQKGLHWDGAMKLVAPLVMRFDTQPPTVQMADSTAGVTYRERVKQLFPAQYQKMAFEQSITPAAMADLRRRYNAAAGL